MEKKKKPANTDSQARRRKNAVQGAAVSTVTQLLSAAVLLWLRAGTTGFLSKLALILALVDVVTVIPVWVVLRARLREIEKGEEAVLGTVVFEVLMLLPIAIITAALRLFSNGPVLLTALLAISLIICLLPMGIALVVLYQRFKEIKGGELDAAAEY